MDIGSYYDIHPKEKMEVGRRLALLARGKTYGEDILCQSPRLQTVKRLDNVLHLTFEHCNSLRIGDKKSDWKIEQNGTELMIDSITAEQNTLFITLKDMIDSPVSISLGYSDYAEIHIWNEADLPICPFAPVIC